MEILQEIFLAAFVSLFFAFLLAKFFSFICDSENSSPKPENSVEERTSVGVFEDDISRGGDRRMGCGPSSEEEQKVRVLCCYERKETLDTVAEVREQKEHPDSGEVRVEDCESRVVHAQGGMNERDERYGCSDSGEATIGDRAEGCERGIIGVREVRGDKKGAAPELERDHVSELRSLRLEGISEENSSIEHEEGSPEEVEVLEKTVDGDKDRAYLKEEPEAPESLNILDVAEVQADVDGGIELEEAKKEDQENCEKDRDGRYEGNPANISPGINFEPTERAEARDANGGKDQAERFEENRAILRDLASEMRFEEHETIAHKVQKEQSDEACEEEGDVMDEEWEGIERSEVAKLFTVAECFIASSYGREIHSKLGNDVQMQLYGLQKVATEGPCYESSPSALKPATRAKWHAWQRLGSMNPEVAMEQYMALLSEKVPDWQVALSREVQDVNGSNSNKIARSSSETQDFSSSSSHQPDPHLQSMGEEIHTCNHGNVDFGAEKFTDGSGRVYPLDHPTGDSSSSS